MARKRKGRPISGWVIIDKPLGLTSQQVVGRVRRILDAQKAGHGGTLDPLASGVLPIALGEATKTMSFVMDGEKAYRFEVTFGEARSTDDAEGEVTETSDHRPTQAEIEAALPSFVGKIEQVPPIYSAIKVDGQRAYKLARRDEEVTLAARTVEIHSAKLIDMPAVDKAVIEISCGKGTYVRSLARDLAKMLGTCGYVSMLRRIKAGPFGEERAISLDFLESLGHSAPLEDVLLPIMTALDDISALALTEDEAKRVRHGNAVGAPEVLHRQPEVQVTDGETVILLIGETPIALARIEDGEVRPARVLNL